MRLVVISNETFFPAEAKLVNQLFEQGLSCFHLRKPNASCAEIAKLLDEINEKFHPFISLHQRHEIAHEYGINRLHFSEESRQSSSASRWDDLKKNGSTLSTSIHNLQDLPNVSGLFDYTFFSPVFNSISKEGYKGILTEDFKLTKGNLSAEIIALGGINSLNISLIKKLEFDGAAVLGCLWKKPKNALTEYKKLRNYCQ